MRRESSFAAGLSALVWLDLTAFGHRMQQVLRDRRRLVVWLIFALWLAMVVGGKMVAAGQGGVKLPFIAWTPAIGALIPGVYVVVLGLVWQGAARRAPAVLSSPADGRFLLGSELSPRLVALWLQLRQAWVVSRALLMNAVIWLAILLPSRGMTVRGVLVGIVGILLATLVLYGVRLPVFVLARRVAKGPVTAMGFGIMALGAAALGWQLYSALASGLPFVRAIAYAHVRVPLGDAVQGAIAGHIWALLLVALLAGAGLWLTAWVAKDCYPEIWESSQRQFAVRRLVRRGRFGGDLRAALADTGIRRAKPRRAAVSASQSATRLSGAWVVLWKEWLAIRRAPGGARLQLLWLAGAALAGFALGMFAVHQHGSSVIGMIVGFAVYPALLLTTASGVSLAADLRRPIWWLSSEGLATRLLVWTLATSLRGMAIIAVGLAAAALSSGIPGSVLPVVPLGMLAIWLLRAVGLAIYALMPSQLDLRGPGAALRLVLSIALLIPAGVVSGIAGAIGGTPAALGAGALGALVEGLLLVLFAASHLRGNGMAVAQAEQR